MLIYYTIRRRQRKRITTPRKKKVTEKTSLLSSDSPSVIATPEQMILEDTEQTITILETPVGENS